MNRLQLVLIVLSATLSVTVLAEDAHHPDQANTPSAAAAAPAAPVSVEKSVQLMKENAKKMQAQLDKIGRAKNAQERQKLLLEHMRTMRENMMLGRGMMMGDMGCPMMEGGMMGDGMMGGGMMGGGMMGGMGGGAAPDAAMNRMNMMEKRMDMMQMMMEQMTRRQEGQQPMPMK